MAEPAESAALIASSGPSVGVEAAAPENTNLSNNNRTISTDPTTAATGEEPPPGPGSSADHQLQQQLQQHAEDAEQTPEEEEPAGYLASRLNTVFGNALAHTLKVCSYGNFAACFPTPASRRPETLRSVWQQIVGKIEAKARSEYGGIMAERDVVRGLNELERLIGEAKKRKEAAEGEEGDGDEPVAPHTLPPESLYAAHLAPELEPIRADLQRQIDSLSAENERLAAGIEGQRTEVETLLSQLEATVKDLEGANEALEAAVGGEGGGEEGNSGQQPDIRAEILEAQEDLRQVRDRT